MENNIKELILDDIETLKTFNAPMLSANEHYKKIGVIALKASLIIYLVYFVISIIYALTGKHMDEYVHGMDILTMPLKYTLICGSLVAGVICLLIVPSIASKIVIFKECYQSELKSGDFIYQEITRFIKIITVFFIIVSSIVGWFASGVLYFGNFIGFILTLFFSNFLLSSTFDRIGIPNLPSVLEKITKG